MALDDILWGCLDYSGPFFYLLIQSSLLAVSHEIWQTGNSRGLSSVPCFALMSNSFNWAIFGFLKRELPVFLPNCIGTVSGFICVVVYSAYSKEAIPLINFIAAFAVISLSLFLAFCVSSVEAVGLLGDCLSVFMMASPLATLLQVVRDKSTRSMPFYTSLTSWAKGVGGGLYAYIRVKDIILLVPNLLGVVLASGQLLLFAVYSRPEVAIRYTPVSHNDSDATLNTHVVIELAAGSTKETTTSPIELGRGRYC